MPFSTPDTVFPTQRPFWADDAMAQEAKTDHGHVVEARGRESTLGYLARLRAWRTENSDLDIPGAKIMGCILFPVTETDKNGREIAVSPLQALGASYKAGQEGMENLGKFLGWGLSLLRKDRLDPISRIQAFDWSDGAKPLEAERGKVERMGPAHADESATYGAYPRRPATGMDDRGAARRPHELPAAQRALPAPARALPAPPRQLPRPDRGQDR